jgi:hypothetical protein
MDMHGVMSTMSMYNYRSFMNNIVAEEAAKPMTPQQAQAEIDQKYRDDVSMRNKVEQAKLDQAKIRNAMPLQFAKEIELQAQRRLEERGEGEGSAAARAADKLRGDMATGFGFLLPQGMSSEELGRRIRVEQEMKAIVESKGLKLPGRPNDTSPLGGYTAGYLQWLTSGGAEEAYSQAGTESELHARLNVPLPGTGPKVMPSPQAGGPMPPLPGAKPQAAFRRTLENTELPAGARRMGMFREGFDAPEVSRELAPLEPSAGLLSRFRPPARSMGGAGGESIDLAARGAGGGSDVFGRDTNAKLDRLIELQEQQLE